jgi:hypothetical protein
MARTARPPRAAKPPAGSRTAAANSTGAHPIMSIRRLAFAGTSGRLERQKGRSERRQATNANQQAEGVTLLLAQGLEDSFVRIREIQDGADRDLPDGGCLR